MTDFLKKLKSFKPSLDLLSPGILLGCFFFVICLLLYPIFLDSTTFHFRGEKDSFLATTWFGFNDSLSSVISNRTRVGFLEESDGFCDVFHGNWVWDESYPLYKSRDCMFLDEGFRCLENGRPDDFYTKWRWQPNDCNLPRFDAKDMLEKLRNRRLVFVGDSIGRNQWESLLCMLSSAVSDPKNSIYEVNGNPITKHSGALIFKFKDFNCTIEYYRAPFLVVQGRPPPGAPSNVKMTLKLDQMDWSCSKWKGADILVFNSGHWWTYEKTIKGGCYFQEKAEIKMDLSVEKAYSRSIETLMDWIGREVDTTRTLVFFRTFAPIHFRGGDWKTNGSCHLETLPEMSSSFKSSFEELSDEAKTMSDGLLQVLEKFPLQKKKIEILNVTAMSSRRKDGHLSLYYLGLNTGPAPLHRQDCSHWCLPGVPDSWNELLYAVFLKKINGPRRKI